MRLSPEFAGVTANVPVMLLEGDPKTTESFISRFISIARWSSWCRKSSSSDCIRRCIWLRVTVTSRPKICVRL